MVLCCVGADQPVPVAEQVRRLIAERCLKCHGGVRERGQLDLHGTDRASRPAASGHHAVVPGDPASSELLRRIAASDPDERMPPDGPALAAADRDLLPDANERTRVAKLDYRRHPQRNEALRQLEEQADVMTPVPASASTTDGLGAFGDGRSMPAWDAPELR